MWIGLFLLDKCLDILNIICLVVYPTYCASATYPSVLQVTKYIMVFLVLQLKNCFGCGIRRLIGNFCFRVVLSAKHLVSSIGHYYDSYMLNFTAAFTVR